MWQAGDDPALRRLMQAQMRADPGWPPDYARGMNLTDWLASPADISRWTALEATRPIGHIGVGSVPEGPMAELWRAALPSGIPPMAEICRLIVDPKMRRRGLANLLTRKAVRSAIEAGYLPVANALEHRDASLAMMTAAGWRVVGSVPSTKVAGGKLIVLIPPRKLIDAACGG